jgi:hypothetical protein
LRLGKYGQSNVTKADGLDGFDPVPVSIHVPTERCGAPLAFVRGDFIFLDAGNRCIDDYEAVCSPHLIKQVRIRFRYDKSPNSFVFRTYNQTAYFLCAVEATLSLTRRAMALHRDFARGREPLAMFRDAKGRCWTVRGWHMQAFMKRSCIIAHPEPTHHLHRHIKCLTSHCLRVTAAVALFNSGEKDDMTAFRLRWNSNAVRIYLQDCYKSIGTLTLHGRYKGPSQTTRRCPRCNYSGCSNRGCITKTCVARIDMIGAYTWIPLCCEAA